MIIDTSFTDNIRKLLWHFKLFREAEAALTPEERELLKVMGEADRSLKHLNALKSGDRIK